ncbi:hypothetical protein [Gallaecimonas xiamenensis]|uniref:B box-type domain-containing protein n=1 Tax=Gallaecimonas xiamenensis 3-C-1 TaxID=745411 RepID=K2J478_9GAMM|nr:hypothetical protein [Gallaecimonas xiamenensis]EKE77836.1 hypothetical protein B3C1_00210 [Gallaecimonas xiamenensis 3-C-1]
MQCYHHQQQQAHALCKHCHKGLCASCTLDSGWGLACSEPCRDELLAQQAAWRKNSQMLAASKTATQLLTAHLVQRRRHTGMLLGSMVMLLLFCLAIGLDRGNKDYVLTIGALLVVCIVSSLLRLRANSRALAQLAGQGDNETG